MKNKTEPSAALETAVMLYLDSRMPIEIIKQHYDDAVYCGKEYRLLRYLTETVGLTNREVEFILEISQ